MNVVRWLRGQTVDSLVHGAAAGDLARVRATIAGGVDVDARCGHGHTALTAAAGHGHRDVVRLLLDAKADPNEPGVAIGPVLRTAMVQSGRSAAGARLDDRVTGRLTPLMLAAMTGDDKTIRPLLAAGARKDDTNSAGDTAYVLAKRKRQTGAAALVQR